MLSDYVIKCCEMFDGEVYAIDQVSTRGYIMHMGEEVAITIEPQFEQWITEKLTKIDSAGSIEELMEIGQFFWGERYTPTVLKAVLHAFRKKAVSFISPPQKVVVVDLPGVYCLYGMVPNGDVVEQTVNRLRAIHRETAPSKFIVAMDARELDRKARYPEFKGNRPPKPEGFYEGLDTVSQYLIAKGMQVECVDGCEADDILCSVAYRSRLLGSDCILVTEDSDLWQSLGGNVAIYSVRENEYRNTDWLMAKHGITAAQVVDWLALSGKNDVAHANGIAAVTASKMLRAFGNFWGVWDFRKKLTPANRKSIEEFVSTYPIARDVHTLRRDLPITIW